jgi:hypothetical protein
VLHQQAALLGACRVHTNVDIAEMGVQMDISFVCQPQSEGRAIDCMSLSAQICYHSTQMFSNTLQVCGDCHIATTSIAKESGGGGKTTLNPKTLNPI